jgi:hypothetical protein
MPKKPPQLPMIPMQAPRRRKSMAKERETTGRRAHQPTATPSEF